MLQLQRILLASVLLFYSATALAQGFDAEVEDMARELAQKIDAKEKAKVAVWGFFAETGKNEALETLLAEDFSMHLANYAKKFGVVDRAHLKVVFKEHRLHYEGYIDQNTAKRLGKLIAADAVVVGTYTILSSEIKIRLKVLDTETALQIGGVIGTIPMDDNIAKLLGKL